MCKESNACAMQQAWLVQGAQVLPVKLQLPPPCRGDGAGGGVMCMVDMDANSARWAIAGGVWMRCMRDECLPCVRVATAFDA